MVTEWVRLGFELLLGGGLIMTIKSVRTLKHDVERAKQEARAQEIENERSAMDTMQTYIVKPIKRDIYGLRKEMARLRRAIDKIKSCDYSDNCPVTTELQRSESIDAAAESPYGDGLDTYDDYR